MDSVDSILTRAIVALEQGDARAFAACFSADAEFSDYCPASNGYDSWFCFGSAGIEMFFIRVFADERFAVFCPKREDENRVSFFGIYGGPFVYAMFEIKDIGDDGLIKRAVVYPT